MSNVRYLKKEEFEYWNSFVENSEQGSCFSKIWWLEIATNNNFKICIYEGDGEIFAGLILPNFKNKNIKMPKLTQSTGILFFHKKGIKIQKKLTNQKEQTNAILEFIEKDIKSFDLNFHFNYKYWLPFYWRGFQETTRYTYIINYNGFDTKEHFSTLSKGHKWILNRVKKKTNLEVFELENLEIFYEMSKQTYKRQGRDIGYSYEDLNLFHNKLKEKKSGKMFMVMDEEKNIHAVNYIVYDKNEAYYWLGASNSEYRNVGGHTFLIWETIKYFSKISKVFNFGGSMIEEVEKNFRNFNGELTPYVNIYSKNLILKKEIINLIPKNLKTKLKKIKKVIIN